MEVLGKLTNKLNLKNRNIIILPCSHEISVKKDKSGKSCDEVESSKSEKMALENFPVCVLGSGISLKGTFGFDKDKGCKEQNGYPIDWSYYLAFYDNTMRGIYRRSRSRLRCRDTNMVVEALNIIKNGPYVIKQYKNKIKKSVNSQDTENNNSNTEIVSNNSNIIITQQYLNEIFAISKILKNNIEKYKWEKPPKNLLIAKEKMNKIVRNLKPTPTNGDFMKISGENYDIISSIKKIIPKKLLNKELLNKEVQKNNKK